jgi:SOS response regulatory protein OraA/RecX
MEALANKGRGSLRRKSEMRQKGLGDEPIRNTLEDGAVSMDERERAKAAAKKAYDSIADKSDLRKAKAKVNRRLVTLGFSYSLIGDVMRTLDEADGFEEEDEDQGN